MTDFPNRPDHEDFWTLASIVQKLDVGLDPNLTDDDKESAWLQRMSEVGVDVPSAVYMATQRGYRVSGNPLDMVLNAKLASAWLEGLAAGVLLERGKSHE